MSPTTHLSAIQSGVSTMNYLDIIITDDNLHITLSKKYIETLYLSTNLHEHIESNDTDYNKHLLALNEFYNSIPSLDSFIGISGGREWYQFDNYRIGVVVDYELAKRANWYTCIIQYSQSHMFTLSHTLEDIDLPFSNDISKYHINRIDVTHIYKSPIDYLNGYGVISRYRKITTIENKGVIETKYFGTRSSGNTVRWYNKTKELEAKEDYKKIELVGSYFGGIDNLYTIELELRRDYLKRNNIDTLQDLEKVYLLYNDNVGSMRIYENTEANKSHINNKNYDRIATLKIAEYERYERPKRVKKSPSTKYFIERFKRSFERFSGSKELGFVDRIQLMDTIGSIMFNGVDKEVTFYIEDSEEIKSYNRFKEKIEVIREGQDDKLFNEANNAFAPIMLQKPEDVF
jgi:hypothetical protein